ncbi:response regulator [Pseudocolwellia sp. HL-MZ19]|uniref:response regulator n=1 Tax=unclassified Pseudocolwellia TaxID=2848178 RepID=UPI003CED4100
MKRVNVLIVDDNELDRYILRRQLTKIGVESIIEKDDGSTALEFLNDYDKNAMLYPDEFPPVVIFLDINMPKVNGFDFLKEFSTMRTRNELASIVVCMYSSSERLEDKEKAAKFDFVADFIVKGEVTEAFLANKITSLR